ncbi:MAG: diguanylate cyclase, partial [Pseudomonadota bacterium]
FNGMLESLLQLTESKYGFIGEVFQDPDGSPFLKTHAITNIAWNEETRRFYDESVESGMEFRNMNTLFGSVMTTGEPVIANAPAEDRRRGGTPEGHPDLNAFLGLPFHHRGVLIGMVGIANRANGYDEQIVESLTPFLTTCVNIILSMRGQQQQSAIEQSLRESETRGRAILDNAIDAIITIDNTGRIESCNRAASRTFGYGTNEMVGLNVSELMPPSHGDRHNDYINAYLQSGRGRIIGVGRELTARRRDGSEFPVELAVNELKLEGRRLFVGILRDISERIASEERHSRLTAELTARVEELDRLNEQNEMLSELGSYLQACLTKEEAYEVLLAHARSLFDRESGALYRLTESNSMECVLAWGPERDALASAIQRTECWGIRRGELHESGSARSALRCHHFDGFSAGQQLCVPVMTQNGPIGLLTLHLPAVVKETSLDARFARNRSILAGIADRLAPTLSGIELRMRLQEDSIRDPLTKLYNRRFMLESVHRELLRARRSGAPVSVILLDLDNFKRINDEFGHDVGDQVLALLGQQLTENVREEDYVYRYGGEEFLIMLPGASLEVAEQRALQAAQAARTLSIDTDKGPVRLTLSAGIACYPDHGQTQEAVLLRADKALYEAKNAGRNRIHLAKAS